MQRSQSGIVEKGKKMAARSIPIEEYALVFVVINTTAGKKYIVASKS